MSTDGSAPQEQTVLLYAPRKKLYPREVRGVFNTWRWVLVAPTPMAPEGFVNVQTGETHKVVW